MIANPQVLHIGFSKCASTYLRSLFRDHAGVHLVFKSGFFTPFLATDMTFADYQGLFLNQDGIVNVESDEHLTLPGVHPTLGVRTTSLAEFEKVADKIREYLPDVKIIMVVRSQASLLVSRYSEYLVLGGSLRFDDFVRELLGEGIGQNQWYQNYYRRMIGILEERFPRSNLLILLQEAMREDTQRTTADICSFMGLREDLHLRKGLRRERRSLSHAAMTMLAWLNRFLVKSPSFGSASPTTHVPLALFNTVVRAVRALDYFLIARMSRPSSSVMSADHARAVLAHFREDNLALQNYFQRNLAELGYLQPEP